MVINYLYIFYIYLQGFDYIATQQTNIIYMDLNHSNDKGVKNPLSQK